MGKILVLSDVEKVASRYYLCQLDTIGRHMKRRQHKSVKLSIVVTLAAHFNDKTNVP